MPHSKDQQGSPAPSNPPPIASPPIAASERVFPIASMVSIRPTSPTNQNYARSQSFSDSQFGRFGDIDREDPVLARERFRSSLPMVPDGDGSVSSSSTSGQGSASVYVEDVDPFSFALGSGIAASQAQLTTIRQSDSSPESQSQSGSGSGSESQATPEVPSPETLRTTSDETAIPQLAHSSDDGQSRTEGVGTETPFASTIGSGESSYFRKESTSGDNSTTDFDPDPLYTPIGQDMQSVKRPLPDGAVGVDPAVGVPGSKAGSTVAGAVVPSTKSLGGTGASVKLEEMMTVRFEHVQTDDGHMVLTGREGKLERCEDEPIHIPGAIQSFGALVALEESPEKKYRVVQVSENSADILGWKPSALFALDDFLECLDEEDRETFAENVELMDEQEEADGLKQHGPHTFRIAGVRQIPRRTPERNTSRSASSTTTSQESWQCWCASHRPDPQNRPTLIVLEFELVEDDIHPLSTEVKVEEHERGGLDGEPYIPTEEDLKISTTSISKPMKGLAKLRREGHGLNSSSGLAVFQVLGQVNEQLGKAEELEEFLKVSVGLVKELTGFHRVMIYQFDEAWNGQVVSELVDWTQTRDLYRGLHFPASDIPAQARELYKINKVRLLYDRDLQTARLVCKDREELQRPLNMTHCHLRAMSPIHVKYLGNMGVRASMSISVIAFGTLWGLISCHSYGKYGKRVSFPIRQLCRLLGDSISANVERLSYARRLQARKLINTSPSTSNPSGYIVANADDLLRLFDAEFGVISIGEEAKIFGPLKNSQEVIAVLEYLRMRGFTSMQATQEMAVDFPDIHFAGGFDHIAGFLYIPLSRHGRDFIAFFRTGQLHQIHWAGNPYQKLIREGTDNYLEPRTSFKLWSETVHAKTKAWTDEQLETASVLCIVYGKFIEVWRQKEAAQQASQLTSLLISNASHEVRTPLNQIINFLEMALEGPLDNDTRDNLSRSYEASRTLIHVINDLLDLTRAEQGHQLLLQDPFELGGLIASAMEVHRQEALRQGIEFEIIEDPHGTPSTVLGDRAKLRQALSSVAGNAVKHTAEGGKVTITWGEINEDKTPHSKQESVRVAISVADTGSGIPEEKLEKIFRELEEIETIDQEEMYDNPSLGLGLAVCARLVRNLGGQLRAESKENEGTKFTFVFDFPLPEQSFYSPSVDGRGRGRLSSEDISSKMPTSLSRNLSDQEGGTRSDMHSQPRSFESGRLSQRSEINNLVEAISADPMKSSGSSRRSSLQPASRPVSSVSSNHDGRILIQDSSVPLRPIKMEDTLPAGSSSAIASSSDLPSSRTTTTRTTRKRLPKQPSFLKHISEYERARGTASMDDAMAPLRIMVVEDDDINRNILRKRLAKDNHDVSLCIHGEEAVRLFKIDPDFDIILMDLQMPICDGITATQLIRAHEKQSRLTETSSGVPSPSVSSLRWASTSGSYASGSAASSASSVSGPLPNLPVPPPRRLASSLNGRCVIFAVSASLPEKQRTELVDAGIDGWMLKPLDFKRLNVLMKGILDGKQRQKDLYTPGSWEKGGWLRLHPTLTMSKESKPSATSSSLLSPQTPFSPSPSPLQASSSSK
ncbi:hypothetical protein BT69DRAFT_1349174 [Atractiella rhizophila]|nr:hypothetical protein BT69DRAFT_1349174 [Atractiella rhizophila]